MNLYRYTTASRNERAGSLARKILERVTKNNLPGRGGAAPSKGSAGRGGAGRGGEAGGSGGGGGGGVPSARGSAPAVGTGLSRFGRTEE
jgi:hypothetical protein